MKNFFVVLLTCLFVGTVSATPIILDFPSADSISGGPTGSGLLGAGGGGAHWFAGDDLTETFLGTGLAAANTSRWIFDMEDFTHAGVINTFDLLINGTFMGDFSFVGLGSGSTIHSFDLSFNHASIIGDDYTLRMLATSTVPPGLSSWNWLPGGSVTLDNSVAVPAPSTIALLVLGLVGIGFSRNKKTA